MEDDETEGVILIGEIGGNEEEAAAEYLGREKPPKPVVALVAGRHAPPERRMGHAGAFTFLGQGGAAAKIEALRAAGAYIAENADLVAATMRRALPEKAA
jgi:succinyl-CoA synthetase alpha subunit